VSTFARRSPPPSTAPSEPDAAEPDAAAPDAVAPRPDRSGERRRLAFALAVATVVLAVEIVGGILSGSLALLADAGHMVADVVGIGLALGAIWVAGRPTGSRRTFGLYRVEILAAAVNGLLLIGVAAMVLVEAWRRFSDPPAVDGTLMLGIAIVGLAANVVMIRALHEHAHTNLNVRGAYLEVLGDLFGSVAVIVAAIVIALTGSLLADPIASVVVGLLILPRAFAFLREAIDVLLEAAPRGMRLDDVRTHLLSAEGVTDVHDLHAWTITSGQPVVAVHVVVAPGAHPADVLDELCRCLADDFDVEHSTIQLETVDRRRIEEGRTHA
jgi:cobalt-zinc-cadmium efflux system protein